MVTIQLKNQHLMWRAGFGISVEDIPGIGGISAKELYEEIEKKSLEAPAPIIVAGKSEDKISTGKKLTLEERRARQKQNRKEISRLNLAWISEMIHNEAQLREKMALFWHGHFACRIQNAYHQQLLLQEIRSRSLGDFDELLRAVSKSASMLSFLNNQQNKKQHPNENFAREVMELFTLGRGNYTENDIKEAARAFTGWRSDADGGFVFRKNLHDTGSKTILGKTGNFDGDDVLDILLQQKQTAQFIVTKIYSYFVNENPDEEHVEWLTDRFYDSNYHVADLMKDIFNSDWFYDEKNIGAIIKSPVQLLVGMQRILPMEIKNEQIQLLLQKALGQLLFYPPNVAGWPGGKSWIDSSTLMLRMNLPILIKDDAAFHLKTKPDYDNMEDGGRKSGKKGERYRILASIDWNKYTRQFEKTGMDDLYDLIANVLLQINSNAIDKQMIENHIGSKERINYIRSVTTRLMSTPEYQMC